MAYNDGNSAPGPEQPAPVGVDGGDVEAWFIWAAAAETNPGEYDHAFEDDYHGIWDSVAAFVSTGEWDEEDLLTAPASVGGVHVFTGFAV